MAEKKVIPPYAALRDIGGWWVRGRARLVTLPRTDHAGYVLPNREGHVPAAGTGATGVEVVCIERMSPYPLSRRARAAGRALLRLIRAADDGALAPAVIQFVSRYGPLLNFEEWLARHPGSYGPARMTIQELMVPGHDVQLFREWCDRRGEFEALRYTDWALSYWNPRRVYRDPELPEPIALYRWAAENLVAVQHGLSRDKPLSESVEAWLRARARETTLDVAMPGDRPAGRAGRLALIASPTTLLSHIAVVTALGTFGDEIKQNVCADPKCGKWFPIHDRRMKYCQRSCQDRHRKERKRAGLPPAV